MITEIGIIAGEILMLLEKEEGPVHLKMIEKKLNYPPSMIHMSLGWLIRERIIRTDSSLVKLDHAESSIARH